MQLLLHNILKLKFYNKFLDSEIVVDHTNIILFGCKIIQSFNHTIVFVNI